MRKLFYVPVVHSYDEALIPEALVSFISKLEEIESGMVRLLGRLGDEETRKVLGEEVGDVFARAYGLEADLRERIDRVVNEYWGRIEEELGKEVIDYGGLMVFQDGFYFDLHEIAADSLGININDAGSADLIKERVVKTLESAGEAFNSRNQMVLKGLVERGAILKKTEDKNLFLRFHKSRSEGEEAERDALEKRDVYIAGRINHELTEGVAMLFVGADHDVLPYLERDIEITKIEPFDTSPRLAEATDGFRGDLIGIKERLYGLAKTIDSYLGEVKG